MNKLEELNQKMIELYKYKMLEPIIKAKQEEKKIDCIAFAQNPNDAYAMSTFKKIIHFYDFAKQVVSCASDNQDIKETAGALLQKIKSSPASVVEFVKKIIEMNPMEIVQMVIKAPGRVVYAFTKFCFHLRRLNKNRYQYGDLSLLAYQEGKVMGYGMRMLFGIIPESNKD